MAPYFFIEEVSLLDPQRLLSYTFSMFLPPVCLPSLIGSAVRRVPFCWAAGADGPGMNIA
jgi:hypothetical protein